MSEQLTLYTAKVCPYAHRVEIALAETEIPFTRFEIDLANKPEWYAPLVNPASKVPAIAYGGPQADPSQPSPESVKLTESLVLVEFIADLAASKGVKPLLPSDPVLRAQIRFFVDAVSNSFVPGLLTLVRGDTDHSAIFAGVERIQNLLPKEGGYAIGGEFTVADIAIAPFIARLKVALDTREEFGDGPSKNTNKVLKEDEKYTRFRRYTADLEARDSFKRTFDEAYARERAVARIASTRAQ